MSPLLLPMTVLRQVPFWGGAAVAVVIIYYLLLINYYYFTKEETKAQTGESICPECVAGGLYPDLYDSWPPRR